MSKRSQKALASATIMSLVLSTVVAMPAKAAVTAGTAIGGSDRVATSVEIGKKAYATWTTSKTAVIAYADNANLVDALTVAPLAYKKSAPIFLTNSKTALEAGILDTLKTQKVDTVYIAGGLVNKDAIAKQLADAGLTVTVKALAGTDRYATAAAINAEFGATTSVAVVNGDAVIDALSVAAVAAHDGMAIVLSGKDALPVGTTVAAGTKVYAIGGSGVLSDSLVSTLGATRLGGATRYATNAAVLTGLDASLDFGTVYMANGAGLGVDALPGSVLAAQTKSPIVLTDASLDSNVSTLLTSKAGKVTNIVPLGMNVSASAVDAAKVAVTAGTLEVESVSATGAKTLTVKFNTAVDTTKATFTVNKDSFSVNTDTVTFSADKTQATIVLATNMTEGTYTVSANGVSATALTGDVTVTDEKVAKISFPNTTASLDATGNNVYVSFKVFNQYAEDITSTTSGLSITAGKGSENGVDYANGIITLTDNSVDYVTGNTFALSIIDPSSNVFASTTLTVATKSAVSDMKINSLYNADSAKLDVNSDPSAYYLLLEAKDQYGNAVSAANIAADIVCTVSNTAVANIAGGATTPNIQSLDVNDDGTNEVVLPLAGALTEGTSTVTMISKSTGKMVSYQIVVAAASKVDKLTLSAPSIAVASEDIEIPFTAVDQYGVAVTNAADLTTGITSLNSTLGTGTVSFVQDYVKGTAKLVLDASSITTAQTVVVTAVTGTNKVVQLSISVKAKAVATVISGLDSDFVKTLAVGGTSALTEDLIIVKDQYGRVYDLTSELGATADKYEFLVGTSNAAKVSLTETEINAPTGDTVTLNGLEKGTSTITLTLRTGAGVPIANSAYTFSAKTVEKADIASYELASIGKIYADGATHAADITVNGVLADGSKVAVPSSYYDTKLVNADTDNDALFTIVGTTIQATSGTVVDADTNEATATLIATVAGSAGPTVLTKVVTATKATPVITTLSIADGGATIVEDATANVVSAAHTAINSQAGVDTQVAAILSAVDQYGVDVAGSLDTTNVITNITDDKDIDDIVAGDTLNVTVITSNGKIVNLKFVAK